MTAILGIHYLPCIAWFRHFLQSPDTLLDPWEHYQKQTYRNRCYILAANGPLALSIPVLKTRHLLPMNEVQTDESVSWRRQHWEAIRSAYGSAPFFAHYASRFETYYESGPALLVDFNIALIRLCIGLLGEERGLMLSQEYVGSPEGDLRESLHPKRIQEENFRPYLQVFAARYPFIPNLSLIDVLFNQGPLSGRFISPIQAS